MNMTEFSGHLYNDLIPFWMNLRDDENGGFFGFADENGIPDKKSPKGGILQSRILWFFSSAYMLRKDYEVLSCADHAYRFLRDFCLDHEYGGMFWSVNADGTPCEDMKHTYCQSFALYALSAYYRASGDAEALDLACSLYELIESKCRDKSGYLEAFGRDFSLCENDKLSENGVMADRTMNTLLHLLESYTELLEAEYFSDVEASVLEILKLFKTHVYDPQRKICKVFFDMDYNSIIDLESYGHDIEASWLISRACDVLKDRNIKDEMMPVITGLAEGALEHGIDEQDHAMNNECENGVVDSKKVWWVQAEAVTGFMNAYELTGDEDYLEASDMIWNYIRDNVVGEHGEWIENIYEDVRKTEGQALVHEWKCPYHNGRMCMEMYTRLKRSFQIINH
ncbi:MAG: AGE family epimerase/isomerase [Clostridiales bacterium]|nr:AGE family epimerase/isomerase [Clostridiales bacterium]